MDNNNKPLILIVDDEQKNRQLLANLLKREGYRIAMVADGIGTLEFLNFRKPDLILLDIMLPDMDGFETAGAIKKMKNTGKIPILFITALTDIDNQLKGFQAGGVDYITKPFNKMVLLQRVKTHLNLKIIQDDLNIQVNEKTSEIKNMTVSIVSALENASFYNDDITGNHIERVSSYSIALAKAYKCHQDCINKIGLYASLHDVGKVGISDKILKKPGKYTKKEFNEMKQHVKIGGNMLKSANLDPMAENIARYHHERWDGSGYLEGLKGKEIPLEARIVALADVYDALTTKRPYKKAFSEKKAEAIIKSESGKHFDPELVALFFLIKEELIQIKEKYAEKVR